jgi:hypothetical protein
MIQRLPDIVVLAKGEGARAYGEQRLIELRRQQAQAMLRSAGVDVPH